jgi:hypothetical protein
MVETVEPIASASRIRFRLFRAEVISFPGEKTRDSTAL